MSAYNKEHSQKMLRLAIAAPLAPIGMVQPTPLPTMYRRTSILLKHLMNQIHLREAELTAKSVAEFVLSE